MSQSFIKISGMRFAVIGINFFKSIIITRSFGLGAFSDVYYVILTLISAVSLFFGQLGNGILLPLYNNKQGEKRYMSAVLKEQNELVCFFMTYSLLLTGAVCLIVMLFPDVILQLFAPQITGNAREFLRSLLFVSVPLCLLFQSYVVLTTLMVQQQKFALLNLPDLVSSGLFILSFMLLYNSQKYHLLFWVMPACQIALFIMYWHLLRLPWRVQWQNKHWDTMLKAIAPCSVSALIGCSLGLIDNYFFSQLEPGSFSGYRTSRALVAILSGILCANFQSVLLPRIYSLTRNESYKGLAAEMLCATKNVSLVSLPIVGIGCLLAPPVLSMTFKRGALTQEDVDLLVFCFRLLLLSLPGSIIQIITSGCLNALYMNNEQMWLGIVGLVLRVLMSYLGLVWYGMSGLLMATVLEGYVMLACTMVYLWYKLDKMPKRVNSAESFVLRG